MDIAPTLAQQLARHGIPFQTVHHDYSSSSLHTARAAHIPASKMVKSVVLEDDIGYVMALVPANQYVKIGEVNKLLNRKMGLAIEEEINHLFTDCETGAIPPVGDAYGLDTVVDNYFDSCNDVYIEAGNHTELLHLSKSAFQKLTANSKHASICIH